MELGLATLETDPRTALSLGRRAVLACQSRQQALLVSASFSTDALVLGVLQREDSLRARSPARFEVPMLRRATTGTEAQLSGAVLYHALALPRVDALFPDAKPRTLLNRNLRAILRGYTAAGVPLRYFGTEVLALLGHPVALVGYDQLADGAVLIEVLIGLEQPCVVRSALKRERPAALYELLRSQPEPRGLLERAVNGVVERLGASPSDASSAFSTAALSLATGPAAAAGAPFSVSIPLGVVEAVISPDLRITGDLLCSTSALERVEALAQAELASGQPLSEAVLAPLAGAPLDGARPEDVWRALSLAASSGAQLGV